jgi:hypothetical protein
VRLNPGAWIGAEHLATFAATGEVLQKIGVIDPSVEVRATRDSWIDGTYLRSVG